MIDSTLNSDQVSEYLKAHPDFFSGNEDLLLSMYLPHQSGETVSLVERQVTLLRERNQQARRQLEQIMLAAANNSAIFEKCKSLIVRLLEVNDADGFFNTLEDSFRDDFSATAYSLIIFSDDANQVNHFTTRVTEASAREFVGGLIDNKNPLLGVLRDQERDFLFRHSSDKVASAAVVPVKNQRNIALLSIGSDDAGYFESGMGTIFISFIADMLSRLIPRYVTGVQDGSGAV